jgi:uncharacterized protein YbjT (DUF2867 family)
VANPILVTGAAGRVGAVGRTVTELLLKQGKAVRAMVRNEERAQALRGLGADVVVGNLLDLDSMHRVIAGCETVYFGMSVSDAYLAATVNAAAVAKHHGVKAFINISQMTVSQMSITETTPSPQHKLHWLAEQALNWSGLPVVQVRPTVFLEGFFLTLTPGSVRESDQIRLPFGDGKTSPVAAEDVARVIATLLANPQPHIGKIYHLTGPQSENMHFFAQGARPHHHLSRHSRRAVAGRAAGSRGEPPGCDGRSASRGAFRPAVGRRAHADGASATERARVCEEECRDIHRIGESKRGLSVCGQMREEPGKQKPRSAFFVASRMRDRGRRNLARRRAQKMDSQKKVKAYRTGNIGADPGKHRVAVRVRSAIVGRVCSTISADEPTANQNSCGRGESDEESPFCSR